MKHLKKIMAIFMVVLMIVNVSAVTSFAEGDTPMTRDEVIGALDNFLDGSGTWLDPDWRVSSYAGGDGSAQYPYLISTPKQLAYLSYSVLLSVNLAEYGLGEADNYSGKYFKLTNDIDLSAKYWLPVFSFAGTFDGAGHTISGLTCNGEYSFNQSSGIFDYVAGTIQNLGLKDVDIQVTTSADSTTNYRIGALTANLEGSGKVINCYSDGNISIDNTSSVYDCTLGGLVGENNGFIYSSYSMCGITAQTGNSSINAGGLVGYNYYNEEDSGRGMLVKCFSASTMNIEDPDANGNQVGILCGYLDSSTENVADSFYHCYFQDQSENVTGCGNYNYGDDTATCFTSIEPDNVNSYFFENPENWYDTTEEDNTTWTDFTDWSVYLDSVNNAGPWDTAYWTVDADHVPPVLLAITPYNISFSDEIHHGQVYELTGANKVFKGDTVNFVAKPDDGYTLDTTSYYISNNDNSITDITFTQNDDGTFSFSVPDAQGNIYVWLEFASTASPSKVTSSDDSTSYTIGDTIGVAVDGNLSLTEGDDISMAHVYITSGFTAGDQLLFTNTDNITGSYDATKGVLTLTGSDTPANYQTALRSITFKTSAINTQDRTIVFTLGNALYNPGNGHYYEYVNNGSNISWTDAQLAAATKTFYGSPGYLVTIVDEQENNFLRDKLGADAWIGASDSEEEGTWMWMNGPEQSEIIYRGQYPSGTTVSYSNWNNNEPNNSGNNENYAVMFSTATESRVPGKWNDLPNDPSGNDSVPGYIVEYTSADGAAATKTVDVVSVPGTPTDVTATAGNGQATVHFTEPTVDGGSDITNYTVTSSPGGITATGTGSPITITGLDNGTVYTFTVTASNAQGTGSSSTASAAVTPNPPTEITSSDGSTIYTVGNMTGIAVDGDLTLTAGSEVSMAHVYITDGFTSGDQLLFTDTDNIIGNYDVVKGVLTLTGSDTPANYQAALRSVTFKSTSESRVERAIVFTLGSALYNPVNGHFYEYVSNVDEYGDPESISWDDAKRVADARKFYGSTGYLVTITSSDENNFLRDKLGADAWIGASDSENESTWKWMDGPEVGKTFFFDDDNPETTPDIAYSNWNTGEPNNAGNEDYAIMYCTSGTPGQWNDVRNNAGIEGYIVEYDSADGAAATKTVDVITVPGAPTGVSATAGNGQATVTFTAPTDNGGSAITGYTVTSSPGNISVAGATSPIVVTGLTNGIAYTFTVKATNTAGTSEPSTASSAVTPHAPSSGGGSSGGGSIPSTPANQDTVVVIVNGKTENAGTETKTTEAGKTTVTVEVKNTVIDSKIEEAIKNNPTGTSNLVQIPVADKTADVVKVDLTGDIVKKLETNTFDVSIKRDTVEYVIPAEELTISKVAKELGVSEQALKDIKVEVQITKLDASVTAKYNEVAKANGAELVFPPVAFEIVAKTTKADGTTANVAINKFSNYVERVMEIPAGVDPSKITTGIVFNPDGTYSHVPTEVFQKDGKWYAKLNSLTNSNYSVIWNPITVKSVENHWSKDAVNDMASRLVVFNVETFAPDKAITRADFAEYIIRALGLYREGSTHANKFSDVKADGDRTLAILIANEYGIVTGYPDGTFRPDALITREEAMTMYQRAMKVTKLTGSDANRYQSYMDFSQVSGWASSYVKEVLSAHVFNGNTATTISPKSNLTYAEAAQAIKNLLVESKLINK